MALGSRVRKIVGDIRVAVGLDRLPSYSESRAQLGGVPWRNLDATDRWFLESADSQPAVSDSVELALPGLVRHTAPKSTSPFDVISASFVKLRRSSLPWWMYALGALGIGIVFVAFR
jgi:hypothetical protein